MRLFLFILIVTISTSAMAWKMDMLKEAQILARERATATGTVAEIYGMMDRALIALGSNPDAPDIEGPGMSGPDIAAIEGSIQLTHSETDTAAGTSFARGSGAVKRLEMPALGFNNRSSVWKSRKKDFSARFVKARP